MTERARHSSPVRRPSIADELRRARLDETLRLSGSERVALALALGRRDLEALCRSSGLDEASARRELVRRRQVGRRPSACVRALLEEPG